MVDDSEQRFSFPNPEPLSTPDNVISFHDVSFGYSPSQVLFEHLEVCVDLWRYAVSLLYGVGVLYIRVLCIRVLCGGVEHA